MSILSEQADLTAVITRLQSLGYVDGRSRFLMGTSQGGAVSAITAADNVRTVRGAILLCPAFLLADQTQERFERVEDIPASYQLLWMTVGRVYAESLLDYDLYKAISGYERDVLIPHGDADSGMERRPAHAILRKVPNKKCDRLSQKGLPISFFCCILSPKMRHCRLRSLGRI